MNAVNAVPAIERIELHRIEVPLVRPFETSFGRETVREVLLVRVLTDAGEGWGECVAGRDPFYSGEYVDGAASVIERYLGPALIAGHGRHVDEHRKATDAAGGAVAEGPGSRGASVPLAASVAPSLAFVAGHRMAKGALEAAVLDAELRAQGRSMGTFFGAEREWVDCGVSVGIAPTLEELMDEVMGYVEEGYRRIKLKIKPGWDVDVVAEARRRHPEILLSVDANSAYTLNDLERLKALDAFNLLMIEQPLDHDDLLDHATLQAELKTPICLDESITSLRRAEQALRLGSCRLINIKVGRVGGYSQALAIHDLCHARGVPVWCGGMLESGVGRAHNLALASLPGFTLPGDISASSRYFERDVIVPEVRVAADGTAEVPPGPGLGFAVDLDYIESCTEAVERIELENWAEAQA